MQINKTDSFTLFFATLTTVSYRLPEPVATGIAVSLSVRKTLDYSTSSLCDASGTIDNTTDTVTFTLDTNTAAFLAACKEAQDAWLEIYIGESKVLLQRRIYIMNRAGTITGSPATTPNSITSIYAYDSSEVPTANANAKNKVILIASGGTAAFEVGSIYKCNQSGSAYQWQKIETGSGITDYTDLENKPSINSVSLSGNKTAADLNLAPKLKTEALASTSFTPEDRTIYTRTLAADDVISMTAPTGPVEFQLDLTQPETPVSFTWSNSITWKFGTPPAMNTGGATYQIKFQYLNGSWFAWLTPEMGEFAKLGSSNTFTGQNAFTDKVTLGATGRITINTASKFERMTFSSVNGNTGLLVGHNCSIFKSGVAFGYGTVVNHYLAFTCGVYTTTGRDFQFVAGKYNVSDSDALFVVGNGTSHNQRANGLLLKSNGDLIAGGDVIATISGNTVSMSSLLARIEALENA